MDEQSINKSLVCVICYNPFVNPVSTPCVPRRHRFCLHCIEKWLQSASSCPLCHKELSVQDLVPVTDELLIDMLNELRVRCNECGKTEIERGNFEDHIRKVCPTANVFCPSRDIKCPWVGTRDLLDNHLTTCAFKQCRPAIEPIIRENQELKEQVRQQTTRIKEHQDRIHQMEQHNLHSLMKIWECENENQQLEQEIMELKNLAELRTKITAGM